MKKISILCLMATIFMSTPFYPAQAVDYVNISGEIKTHNGKSDFLPNSRVLVTFAGGNVFSQIGSDGKYSLQVVSGTSSTLTFNIFEAGYDSKSPQRDTPGYSSWTTEVNPKSDTTVNLLLPPPVKLNVHITDAQAKVLSNSLLRLEGNRRSHNAYQFSGRTWSGMQGLSPVSTFVPSVTGTYQLFFYSSNSMSFNYQQKSATSSFRTPVFPVTSEMTVLLCVPVNFGAEKKTAPICLENLVTNTDAELKAQEEADAKAAAELKSQEDAEAKAAEELQAKQDAALDKAALTRAQSELTAANAALADAQKGNRELQSQLNAVERQFKLLSDSVSAIQAQVSQLNSKLAAALAGQNAANAKLKKVCSAKPKPKGC